jgi:hypothetical protein
MSFPPGTEMFQFPGFASVTYGFSAGYRISGGFPHSEICGSKGARPSPQLIAACHVLHRLSVPRHPPDALKRLISASSTREAPRTVASALTQDTRHHTSTPLPAAGTILHLRPIRAEARFSQRRAIVPSSHSLHNVQYPRSLSRSAVGRGPRISVLSRSSLTFSVAYRASRYLRPRRQPLVFSHQFGGGGRDRTDDLMLAKHALSQLSYAPKGAWPIALRAT